MKTIEGFDLVTAYVDWLKSKIKVKQIDETIEISTPFLDRHNDKIQIYVQPKGDKLILTDDGYILGDLESSGCDINTEKRLKQLKTILNGFGVQMRGEELTVECSLQTFPQKKHALIQSMITVNDMFLTTSGRVASFFLDDVAAFLNLHDVRYMSAINIVGKSGFSHRFDFAIPPSRRSPERLIRALNNPNKEKATDVLFSWTDIRNTRSLETSVIVFLNDQPRSVNSEVIGAFNEYGIQPIEWSKRAQYLENLTA